MGIVATRGGNAAKQGRRQAQSTYSERRKGLQKVTPSQRTLKNKLLARCSSPVFFFHSRSPAKTRRISDSVVCRDNGQARDLLTEVSILLDGDMYGSRSGRGQSQKRSKKNGKQKRQKDPCQGECDRLEVLPGWRLRSS